MNNTSALCILDVNPKSVCICSFGRYSDSRDGWLQAPDDYVTASAEVVPNFTCSNIEFYALVSPYFSFYYKDLNSLF